MSEKVVFIYVTFPSEEEAKKIGKILLEERLCACINLYSQVKSFYWWEGKIEEATESILIVKTRKALAKKVEETILKYHSYTVPCIMVFSAEEGFKPFIEWIYRETKEDL
ncbi:MAG: divalent-cation tolerance protein CutA [Thermodesulfobacteriaceae bacterium]|nr:divalent-cation tolerance protein CutA [Thermodesulfobacteriaceae bacterium]MCX8041488.1 divalent-cation tolerance protein CutA [Thermodesulfobacteriaceae bacterium]MDW8135958.1 divalent-cation tolerance protein CutA [Thermodesulfobacterium sp.]